MWKSRRLPPLVWVPEEGVSPELDRIRPVVSELLDRRSQWTDADEGQYLDLWARELELIYELGDYQRQDASTEGGT